MMMILPERLSVTAMAFLREAKLMMAMANVVARQTKKDPAFVDLLVEEAQRLAMLAAEEQIVEDMQSEKK